MSRGRKSYSKPNKKIERKWYYDACTLDLKSTYPEIVNNKKKRSISAVVSHLALGEATGNCHYKGEEKYSAFLDLIYKTLPFVQVVGHDGIGKQMKKVREIFPALAITDCVHLATALKGRCELMRTTDSDLHKLNKAEVKKLGLEMGINNFSISYMDTNQE